MTNVVQEAARLLSDAYRSGVPCAPLRAVVLPEGDVETAYAVQRAQVARWTEQGRRRVGAKAGLTSPAVQQAFGVNQPDFGTLFADMAVPDGAEVDLGRLIQPRVEAEVAFVLGADLPYEEVTAADVIRATEYLLPSIEIVDSRVAGWDISIVDTVADNGSSGLFVLGTSPAGRRTWTCGSAGWCWSRPVSRSRSARAPRAWAIRSTRWPGWRANWPGPGAR